MLNQSFYRFGSNIAVVDSRGQLMYSELFSLINSLRADLKNNHFSQGNRIVLLGNKSREFLAAILACLLDGIVYIPLEQPISKKRLEIIIKSTSAHGFVKITNEAYLIESLEGGKKSDDEDVLIFYTSGSTGTPKGVRIHAENIHNLIDWFIKQYQITHNDRFSAYAPWHFDLSIIDIFAALFCGASIYCVTKTLKVFPQLLANWLQEDQITIIYMVPTAIRHLLLHSDWCIENNKTLRAIFFAGEPFALSEVKQLRNKFSQIEIANLYGPTETNVSTYCDIPMHAELNKWSTVPIGNIIQGFKAYIENNMEEGELIIEGSAISPGYINDPDSKKFICLDNKKIYFTGDMVRKENNRYIFERRIDRQIKLKGFRIDLNEIEACLRRHSEVMEAAITLDNDELVAYIELKKDCTTTNIMSYCMQFLLREHCPKHYKIVDKIPLTLSGKIDYQKLTQGEDNEIINNDTRTSQLCD